MFTRLINRSKEVDGRECHSIGDPKGILRERRNEDNACSIPVGTQFTPRENILADIYRTAFLKSRKDLTM